MRINNNEIKLELKEFVGLVALIVLVFASPYVENNTTAKSESQPKAENTSTKQIKTDGKFVENVKVVANNLGIHPEDLLTVMLFETAGTLNPAIQRSDNLATGLIQFMPNTAKELNTTVGELKKMDQNEQLVYVERYLIKRGLQPNATTKQLYSTIFCGNPYCSGSVGDGFHTLNGAVAKMNAQHRPIARRLLGTLEI